MAEYWVRLKLSNGEIVTVSVTAASLSAAQTAALAVNVTRTTSLTKTVVDSGLVASGWGMK